MTPATVNSTRGVVAANLRALKSYVHKSETLIAAEMGDEITRGWVNERMTGRTECKATDLARFALYFGVPVSRFFEPLAGDDVAAVGRRGLEPRSAALKERRSAVELATRDDGSKGTEPAGYVPGVRAAA